MQKYSFQNENKSYLLQIFAVYKKYDEQIIAQKIEAPALFIYCKTIIKFIHICINLAFFEKNF